ncbi:Pyridoxine biosynthesis glutamine amidotransferase, glutaminase subunit [Dehalobacter sp. UNSWDHB]|uniref:pyridoxal 5'-phosphate synthase glutaminase subunit PdxT n=1 Tax=unclassified Dehalobacter TaxID=2635733 RepID=UPI00028A50FF|nr:MULTISPECIES: pyridoxal 5'-phosphate synthase glutaminase subunit PdxT [unclassified Dehalobacter]AFV01036.1 Pyridoxine biosynthesis glutamine amidotransferase, glutaminase subunit [Dehalobacter sp. DCA]AFV04014.1 Pyridoxine biosynthesis glutamine amidotransferase, glutaminase subunit [Dehalobacter sp. CF]EQB22432.1 Pyridoxine biosynthesis glutamine amidotransferase, glutaminase subunit [Dehalobacter sp. UNSWDHB]
MSMKKKIGVLAIQGAFREHCKSLEKLGVGGVEVRSVDDLKEISGLIIPGGESTAIGKQLEIDGFGDKIAEMAGEGFPIFGTCAGMILLSKRIDQSSQYSLGLLDISVKRNAFGRQIASFEADIPVKGLKGGNLRAVFIRAPYVTEAGPEVDVLAAYAGKIVLVQDDHILASAFHPELTDDTRIHEYFINIVDQYRK